MQDGEALKTTNNLGKSVYMKNLMRLYYLSENSLEFPKQNR